MKKVFMAIFLMVILFGLLTAVNTTTTGTMTSAGSGWYYLATQNFYKANLLVEYAKGDGTSITLTIGYRYTNETGATAATTYIVSYLGGSSVAASDTIVMDATANRLFVLGVPKAADQIWVKVEYTGGTTATVLIDCVRDKEF